MLYSGGDAQPRGQGAASLSHACSPNHARQEGCLMMRAEEIRSSIGCQVMVQSCLRASRLSYSRLPFFGLRIATCTTKASRQDYSTS
jgi:hypothetical protein